MSRHFRLYRDESGTRLYASNGGDMWTVARSQATVMAGKDYAFALSEDTGLQIEWCNEDEEMNFLTAPRLPGF